MLQAKTIVGHWSDTPEIHENAIVVITDDERCSQIGEGPEGAEFEARLEKELGITDEDVIFYQEEWNPDDVCSGDFIVEEVESTIEAK